MPFPMSCSLSWLLHCTIELKVGYETVVDKVQVDSGVYRGVITEVYRGITS